jgi:eukaryotic-like serine/threonine-protein kinase
MEPDQWHRLQQLLDEALERPPEERARFLDEACRTHGDSDGMLRHEIESLLAAHFSAETTGALSTPFLDTPREVSDVHLPLPFDRVGAWKPGRLLGAGGMGVVYESSRADGAYEREAAIKLIHPGFGSAFQARFVLERNVLARLDHVGIARLLDGGVAPDGRPFVVMERVDGPTITEHAQENDLPIKERLALFLQACDAVDFAHRALVVHRDLKPSHIVVADVQNAPQVKLLDFGVAKLLDVSDDQELTRAGLGPITPQYAAPEQVTGGPITTATDVYALGVILFELLTGERPYDLSESSASQIERTIREVEPRRPSLASPRKEHGKQLAGDLDWITLKALEKDPGRRYNSAAALASDLRRYLDSRPVGARPPTLTYRTRRFVRRNRWGVAAGLMVAVSLLISVSGVAWQAHVASQERDRAERRFDLARETAQVLLYEVDDLLAPLAGTTEVRERIVERSLDYLSRLGAEAADNVPLKIDIAAAYLRAGSILGAPTAASLGHLSDAEESYRRGLAILPPVAGGTAEWHAHALWVRAMLTERLAEARAFQGDVSTALTYLSDALELYRAHGMLSADDGGRAQRAIAIAHIKLGDHFGNPDFPNEGRTVEAVAQYDSALAILAPMAGESDIVAARLSGVVHERRGTLRRLEGMFESALEDYRSSRDIRLEMLRLRPFDYDTQRDVGIAHEKLALLYRDQGHVSDALLEMQAAVEVYRGIAQSDSANVQAWETLAIGHLHLGDLLSSDAEPREARHHYRAGLDHILRYGDPDAANVRTANLIDIFRERLDHSSDGRP